MPLSPTVTPGYTFPPNQPFGLDELRAAATPSVTLSGNVGTSDIDAGAITPAKVSPGAYFWALDTGAVNAFAIAPSPAATAYTAGIAFSFKALNTNTAAATLNVNSLGAIAIKKHGTMDLAAGDIKAGQNVSCQYDGTYWQLMVQTADPPVENAFIGASAWLAGQVGLVPAPTVAQRGYYLKADGNWTDATAAAVAAVTALTVPYIELYKQQNLI
jgi:hypothetical protein